MESYSLDPFLITMDRFHKLTLTRRLVPSRRSLMDHMDERFQILTELGIGSMGELLISLRTKQKVESLANISGIPAGYLKLLRREAGSYLARPFPISEFPGVPFEYVEILKSKGLRHTREYFELVQTEDQRNHFAEVTGIPKERLNEIFALCNLSRITGIGELFARIVYESGMRSVEAFAKTRASIHIDKYKATIHKYGYTSGNLSEEDIQYCIEHAKMVMEFSNKSVS